MIEFGSVGCLHKGWVRQICCIVVVAYQPVCLVGEKHCVEELEMLLWAYHFLEYQVEIEVQIRIHQLENQLGVEEH